MAFTRPYFFESDASPFAWKASEFSMPDGFVFPRNIGTYDGTTDPEDHLFVFTQTMSIYNLSEPVWCKLFSITLMGRARMWFKSLKPQSIRKFDQLAKSFKTTFLHKVKFQKSRDDIMRMMPPLPNESFKQFVGRFNDEILETDTRYRLDDNFEKLVISTYYNCLGEDSIPKHPSTLEELHVRANETALLEDTLIKEANLPDDTMIKKAKLKKLLDMEVRLKRKEASLRRFMNAFS